MTTYSITFWTLLIIFVRINGKIILLAQGRMPMVHSFKLRRSHIETKECLISSFLHDNKRSIPKGKKLAKICIKFALNQKHNKFTVGPTVFDSQLQILLWNYSIQYMCNLRVNRKFPRSQPVDTIHLSILSMFIITSFNSSKRLFEDVERLISSRKILKAKQTSCDVPTCCLERLWDYYSLFSVL